MKEKI